MATGRPCSTCTHPDRALIEAEVTGVEGMPLPSLSTLARRYGLGPHSLRRHLHNHANPAVRAALEPREGADPATVVGRVLAVADAVRPVRLTAQGSGDAREVVRASDSELRALALLGTTFGIDATSTAQALADAQRLAQAVGDAARVNADVGDAIARALDQRGAGEMAEALRREFE